MSLSQPRKTSNPAEKFIEWSGSQGKFRYYDKEVQSYLEVPTPIYFIALDQLSFITGFSDAKKTGIYSNEIHDTRTEELNVRYHGGMTFAQGLYADIKGQIIAAGGKYGKSVYAAMITKDAEGTVLNLVNFKFYGSSLGPWIEAKVGDDGNVIILDKNPQVQTKGQTQYFIPTVKVSQKREELLAKAVEMDETMLQPYFGSVGPAFPAATQPEHLPDKHPDQELYEETEEEDDLPF